MSRFAPLLLSATLATGRTPCDAPTPAAPAWSPDMQAAADGVNRFTFDLLAEAGRKPGSLFLSPWSVATAFALLADGANGPTRDELVRTLRLPADPDAVGDLGRFYAAGGKPYELSVANSLWGQAGYPWRPGFASGRRERFGAAVFVHDFRADPEAGRVAVNRWVGGQTRGRIPHLLPPRSVTRFTRLVLANAVSFKGKWQDEFKPADTRDDPFTQANGRQARVPLMRRAGGYRHAQLDGFQVLELPYQGGQLGMVVIVPADPAGLPAVEGKLAAAGDWLGKLEYEPDVRVFLPRFELGHEADLPGLLKALGLKLPFDPDRADLSRLLSQPPPGDPALSVSGAFHKAFVEVSERGTEAAAATGVVVGAPTAAAPAPRHPVVFRADRPFLFLIRDVQHGTILFAGRYAGPEGSR